MQKKHLGLAVLFLAAAVLISGCGKKTVEQPAAVNNAANNQNQEQNQNQNQDLNQAQIDSQADEVVNPSGQYTTNELLSMKKPLKCAWKDNITAEGDVTNIIYINGNKFYQDVTMSDIGHMFTVSDGEYLYIWNDFNDMASKIKNTEPQTSTVSGKENVKEPATQEQKRDFVCEKWNVDASIFNPPQNKNFKDVTEEMTGAIQDLKENSGDIKQQTCDFCNSSPTKELKDECLKNAGCNK